MKRIYFTLLLILSTFCFFQCSDDKKDIELEAPLKLKASTQSIVPFEKLTVSIDLESDLIAQAYDSIIWKYNGRWWNGINTIPNNDDPRDIYITDYRLGKNKVHAIGYKDGKIKSEASIEYEVIKPENNFFTINWHEKEQETNYYYPSKLVNKDDGSLRQEGIWLKAMHFKENEQQEYAILDFTPYSFSTAIYKTGYSSKVKSENISLPDIDKYDFEVDVITDPERHRQAELMTRSFWHSLVTLNYGKSIFKYDGDDIRETTLWGEYQKRFKNTLNEKIYPKTTDKYPVEIWETSTSYICLFGIHRSWYYVIAEPK